MAISYWGRFEFAKSKGQIHIHLVAILEDATIPAGIQFQFFTFKWNKLKQAEILANWARGTFNITTELLAYNSLPIQEEGKPSPCSARLSEAADVIQDGAELSMFCQMHKCNEYYLRQPNSKNKIKRICRMGCGEEEIAMEGKTPGCPITEEDLIVEDCRGFKKISLRRNHPCLLQTSLHCLQSWRANCDVSIMIFDSDPVFPDLSEIAEVTDYVVSYACKGNMAYAIEKEQLKEFSKE